jgi:hypothetical protein
MFRAPVFLMKLSTLTLLLGVVVCLPQIYGLLNPKGLAAAARGFPRSTFVGYVLVAIATAWFLLNVNAEAISDFAAYKGKMLIAFGAVGLLVCVFVRDFLAVRGLAVLLLLLAKTMVDSARWADTDWRWVISGWAYVLVIVGMWFTISPWRCRDFIGWGTATEARIKTLCVARLGFGLFLIVLALTAFRAAEARESAGALFSTLGLTGAA